MIVVDAGCSPRASYCAFVGDPSSRSAASHSASRHSSGVVAMRAVPRHRAKI
jgi:hypothetical protein